MNSMSLASRLRAATRDAHHRIDRHPALAPLVRSDLQRAHYIEVLRAMAWIYKTLDPTFTSALERLCPGDPYRPSSRSRWLAEDLAHLQSDGPLPQPWQAPGINTASELVGRLYAIEGSTLGGQVIARQLATSIGVGATSGASMFHGHGEAMSSRWAEFLAFADRACPKTEAEAACAAANAMFVELGNLLDAWNQDWGACVPCTRRMRP